MGIVMTKATKSLAGMEYHTPSNPQNKGNTNAIGSRKMSWRERERKMLMRTLPMH